MSPTTLRITSVEVEVEVAFCSCSVRHAMNIIGLYDGDTNITLFFYFIMVPNAEWLSLR